MHYRIALAIDYRYSAPAERARTLVRLTLPDLPGAQRVHHQSLRVTPPPDEHREGADFFGNSIAHLVWHKPLAGLSLGFEAEVERVLPSPPSDPAPDLAGLAARLAQWRDLGPASPVHHLAPSPRIAPSAAMVAFARSAVVPGDARATILSLSRALHRAMTFDPSATTADTPPQVAFAQRRGVCQDYAQILIGALRSLGVPAGYVSGFLRTDPPPGQPRLAGVDAMHAWVRAWDGTGWVEVDPTNDRLAGEEYVTLARGRDYGDAAPVLGALRSAGGQGSRQAVDVVPLG